MISAPALSRFLAGKFAGWLGGPSGEILRLTFSFVAMTRYLFGGVARNNRAIRRIGRALAFCAPPFDNSQMVGSQKVIGRGRGESAPECRRASTRPCAMPMNYQTNNGIP